MWNSIPIYILNTKKNSLTNTIHARLVRPTGSRRIGTDATSGSATSGAEPETLESSSSEILEHVDTNQILSRIDLHASGARHAVSRCEEDQMIVCDPNFPYRHADGRCNNLQHPTWGKSNTCFARLLPADYSDGQSAPRISVTGHPLPNPRILSAIVHRDFNYPATYTHFVMQYGQFFAHDIAFTPSSRTSKYIVYLFYFIPTLFPFPFVYTHFFLYTYLNHWVVSCNFIAQFHKVDCKRLVGRRSAHPKLEKRETVTTCCNIGSTAPHLAARSGHLITILSVSKCVSGELNSAFTYWNICYLLLCVYPRRPQQQREELSKDWRRYLMLIVIIIIILLLIMITIIAPQKTETWGVHFLSTFSIPSPLVCLLGYLHLPVTFVLFAREPTRPTDRLNKLEFIDSTYLSLSLSLALLFALSSFDSYIDSYIDSLISDY